MLPLLCLFPWFMGTLIALSYVIYTSVCPQQVLQSLLQIRYVRSSLHGLSFENHYLRYKYLDWSYQLLGLYSFATDKAKKRKEQKKAAAKIEMKVSHA